MEVDGLDGLGHQRGKEKISKFNLKIIIKIIIYKVNLKIIIIITTSVTSVPILTLQLHRSIKKHRIHSVAGKHTVKG